MKRVHPVCHKTSYYTVVIKIKHILHDINMHILHDINMLLTLLL